MPLPALLKTYEHLVNNPLPGSISDIAKHQNLLLALKNLLTDTVHVNISGATAHIAERGDIQLVSGSTYRINPGDGKFNPAVLGSLVGKTMRLRGNTTSANDGDFEITASSDIGGGTFVLEYVNASAAAEAIIGSVNVLSGALSFPWIMQVCQVGTETPGAFDDEVDRLENTSDFIASSIAGNQTFFVLKNTVTGTEWCFSWDAVSTRNATIRACTAPSVFDSIDGDGNPQGTLTESFGEGIIPAHREFQNEGLWFTGTTLHDSILHLIMSDDGENTILFTANDGFVPFLWWDQTVLDADEAWTDGVMTGMHGTGSAAVNAMTYTKLNDVANVVASRIVGNGGLPDKEVTDLFISSEGYISSAIGQLLVIPNELTGDWPMLPMGLTSQEAGYRGRIGQVKDIYWLSTGNDIGQYFPDDLTRLWLVIGDMVIPWNGSIAEMSL